MTRTMLAAAVAAAALTVPAHAAPGSYSITGRCTFAGTRNGTTLSGVFSGAAVATGPAGSVAMAVNVKCELTNVPAGGTDTATATHTLPGSAGATAGTFSGWDSTKPITACLTATAYYGPLPVVVTLPRTC